MCVRYILVEMQEKKLNLKGLKPLSKHLHFVDSTWKRMGSKPRQCNKLDEINKGILFVEKLLSK